MEQCMQNDTLRTVLSKKADEVLCEASQGQTRREIADLIGLLENTIKNI